jgi:hypothetical protein
VVMVSVPRLYDVGDRWVIWMQGGITVDSEKHFFVALRPNAGHDVLILEVF